MAKIIQGLATPHSPQLRVPGHQWRLLEEKDQKDPRINYQALVEKAKKAKPDIEAELTPELMQVRYEATQKGLDTLRDLLSQAKPEVMVVIGDDQHEQFFEDLMPMFCIFRGSSLKEVARSHGDPASRGTMTGAWRDVAFVDRGDRIYDACPDLAEHLIHSLVQEGFDVAASNKLKEKVGLSHAFTFIYQRLLPEGNIPMVPVMMNDFYPPNQPTPKRCYALGQALRAAIESWNRDKRVSVIASGGLSHVIMDEELDRMTLDGCLRKDRELLCSLPAERLVLGTSENRNWVAIAGVMEDMRMELIGDYVPGYRSLAATGCGMAFAVWS